MENIRQRTASRERSSSISDKLDRLLDSKEYEEEKKETKESEKSWKMPGKWKRSVGKAHKKVTRGKVLVMYLSAKGEIEPPMFLPILGGNIIIYKDKAHEFDPSDFYLMSSGNKIAKILIVREIDRKPVSNKDWADVKARGDSTRDDEVLLKMLKLAMVEKVKKAVNKSMLWLLGLAGGAVVAYLLFFK